MWNDALAFCKQAYQSGEKYCGESELQKLFITQAKKTDERIWLGQVSAIPLQQSIRDLGQAFSNFFKSCTGKRKGKKLYSPKFKKRMRGRGFVIRLSPAPSTEILSIC